MATIPYVETFVDTGVIQLEWALIKNGDTCQPYVLAGGFPDKSFQVTGTFGVGGTIKVEGSNWGIPEATPTFVYLSDPLGNAISLTSAGLKQILENVIQIRPAVTAGDVSTSLTARLLITTVARRG